MLYAILSLCKDVENNEKFVMFSEKQCPRARIACLAHIIGDASNSQEWRLPANFKTW